MSTNIQDLPDEILESIFLNLKTLRERSIHVELVCKKWRLISFSLWKRVTVIDGSTIGTTIRTCKFRNAGNDLKREMYGKSNAIWQSICARIDFGKIFKLKFKSEVVCREMMEELLANCPKLTEVISEDVIIIEEEADSWKIEDINVDFSIPDVVAQSLQVFSLIEVNYGTISKSTFQSLRSLVDFRQRDAQIFTQVLQNNSNTLRAIQVCSAGWLPFNWHLFASVGLLPNLKWLRVESFGIFSFVDVFGKAPNLKYLFFIFQILLSFFPAYDEYWHRLASSKEILQLKELAIKAKTFGSQLPSAEMVVDWLTNLISRRNADLDRMKLKFYFENHNSYHRSNIEEKDYDEWLSSMETAIRNEMGAKFQAANL